MSTELGDCSFLDPEPFVCTTRVLTALISEDHWVSKQDELYSESWGCSQDKVNSQHTASFLLRSKHSSGSFCL